MGVSLCVTVTKKIGMRTGDYPALGNGLDRLDRVLGRAGLPTLGAFVSMDPDEWRDMDPDDPDAEVLPRLQWFDPADGLTAIDAAATHLRVKPKCLSWLADALDELVRIRAELAAADRKKARFRFEIRD